MSTAAPLIRNKTKQIMNPRFHALNCDADNLHHHGPFLRCSYQELTESVLAPVAERLILLSIRVKRAWRRSMQWHIVSRKMSFQTENNEGDNYTANTTQPDVLDVIMCTVNHGVPFICTRAQ